MKRTFLSVTLRFLSKPLNHRNADCIEERIAVYDDGTIGPNRSGKRNAALALPVLKALLVPRQAENAAGLPRLSRECAEEPI
jgi:hypothetical protein